MSRFLWQTFPVCFSRLRIMEVPFPPLSTSLCLPSSRLMTLGLTKKKIRSELEKHFQLTQRGTASSTCYSLPPHVLPYFCRLSKSLHSSAIYLSPVFSVCTANLQCLWDCSKFNKILFSEGYKIPRTPVKIWSQRGSQFS